MIAKEVAGSSAAMNEGILQFFPTRGRASWVPSKDLIQFDDKHPAKNEAGSSVFVSIQRDRLKGTMSLIG
jgi:hypothetical protein